MDAVISFLLNVQIEVLTLESNGTNLKSCQSECGLVNGHLPFLFEVVGKNRNLDNFWF